MKNERSLLIIAAAGAAAFAALKLRESGESGAGFLSFPALDSPLEFAREVLTDMTMSNADALENPNVRAMLALIRKGEGTADAAGYSRLVGGGEFASFAGHPRIHVYIRRLNIWSTAAGAYQIRLPTWEEVRRTAALRDFSPRSQDLAAVQLIRGRGVLSAVMDGQLDAALEKLSYEWASLPPYRYAGQGTLTLANAKAFFVAAGGQTGDIYA
jgi:muramidase (phage lysozyme)